MARICILYNTNYKLNIAEHKKKLRIISVAYKLIAF